MSKWHYCCCETSISPRGEWGHVWWRSSPSVVECSLVPFSSYFPLCVFSTGTDDGCHGNMTTKRATTTILRATVMQRQWASTIVPWSSWIDTNNRTNNQPNKRNKTLTYEHTTKQLKNPSVSKSGDSMLGQQYKTVPLVISSAFFFTSSGP